MEGIHDFEKRLSVHTVIMDAILHFYDYAVYTL